MSLFKSLFKAQETPKLVETLIFWNEDHFFAERIKNSLEYADIIIISEYETSFSIKESRPFKVKKLLKQHGINSKKIKVIEFESLSQEAWQREADLRNSGYLIGVKKGWITEKDILLVQDFDEWLLPSYALKIRDRLNEGVYEVLHLPYWCSYYYLNYQVKEPADHQKWMMAFAAKVHYMKSSGETPADLRLRYLNNAFPDFCGWHHSYMGDTNYIANKIRSFSHFKDNHVVDVNEEIIRETLSNGTDLFGRDFKFEKINYSQNGIPSLQERSDLIL